MLRSRLWEDTAAIGTKTDAGGKIDRLYAVDALWAGGPEWRPRRGLRDRIGCQIRGILPSRQPAGG